MCLETRAGGEPSKAGRDARSEGGGDYDGGTEMPGTTEALATERLAGEAEIDDDDDDDDDDSSGSEGNGGNLPPAGVGEKSGVVLEIGEADAVGKRLTAITTAVAVAASMTGMKVVAVAGASLPVAAAMGVAAMDVGPVIGLTAAAAAAAPQKEELWGWRSDLLCPECGGVVATQEEAALAQQR
ncbi:unnamed protein product [Ectocarpus sp. 12 AP-2014]